MEFNAESPEMLTGYIVICEFMDVGGDRSLRWRSGNGQGLEAELPPWQTIGYLQTASDEIRKMSEVGFLLEDEDETQE